MKPKTKLQVEVWKLHQQLDNPKEHEAFIISKHDMYYTTHYKNIVCLECNHTWKPDMAFWKEDLVGVECPSCTQKLKKIAFENGSAKRFFTYSIVQTVGRFQVFRFFSCWKYLHKNKKPEYYFRSLFEEWKEYEKNKSVIVGRTPNWTGDGFSWSDYEVRYINQSSWKGSEYDRFVSDVNCPGAEFLPRFKKYGLGKDFHNCDYRRLIKSLVIDSKIETLLKAKQSKLLFYAVHKDSHHSRYWPQIKIALRHKYKISDPGIWYDYLQLLGEFGKDLRSPKYILPKNLKIAHNEYVAKRAARIARERAEQEVRRQENERLKAEAEEALRNIKSEVFKDFSFKQGNIKIVTLIDDEDVMKEGKALKHCVHTNNYHKKAGILLMSARVDGKRMETIEISLASYKVIQCRGLNNSNTKYHDQILEIVRKNMGKISKLVEKHKKIKEADSNLSKIENEAAA